MKIGIHLTEKFNSEGWVCYCQSKGIPYKLVDCYRSDIMEQLADCDALMWHFNHKSARASKFAKQLLFSVLASGKKVFPDFSTAWHFDDKLGQKYLLEALNIPSPPAYAFYTKKEALKWASGTTYPKVFKLRNGSSSDNVKLVRSRKEASRLISRAFGRGFKQYRAWSDLMERQRKYRIGKNTRLEVLKGVARLFMPTAYSKAVGREKGYVYFQDFVPGNDHDTRVFVVGGRACALVRMARKNDFRASGSGDFKYEKENFKDELIALAFEMAEKLKMQSVVFDFVYLDGQPMTVEISYGTLIHNYIPCAGYWDRDLNFHHGSFNPCGWMVDDLIERLEADSPGISKDVQINRQP